jgi:hypothetical protein
MTIVTKSVRVAAAATMAIGIASQTAVDVANRSERSATIVAIQAPSISPNVAVMRMRSIRQLRTLTPAQRTRIDETLGRYRQAIRDAATTGDPSREVGSLLADVENVLTPVQRRQVVDTPSLQ